MGIARAVMDAYRDASGFFVPFILIAIFTMLNLFIGIIVDTMQTMHGAEHEAEREQIEGAVHGDTDRVIAEVETLRGEIAALRMLLEQDRPVRRSGTHSLHNEGTDA